MKRRLKPVACPCTCLALTLALLFQLSSDAQSPRRSTGKTGQKGSAAPARKVTRLKVEPPARAWLPPKGRETKAVLLCIHGLGLHSGSYEEFGKVMAALGVATFAMDVRGFGAWLVAKGHYTVDFDGCLTDVKSTLEILHTAYPKQRVFLLGESMGGAIALRAASLYPELIDGVVSSVPAGDRFQQKRTSLEVALHLLDSPSKPFNVGKRVIKQATEDPALRQQWEADPLNRLALSPKELIQFQRFMNDNHDAAKMITDTPILIVQGCRDRLVKPEGTVELFNELATAEKVLVMLGSAEHLIFEEDRFSRPVVNIVIAWLNSLPAKKPAAQGAQAGGAAQAVLHAQPAGR